MSVAELTAPANASAANVPVPPADASGTGQKPPLAPAQPQRGTLPSTGYAPHPQSLAAPPEAQGNVEYAQVISVTPLSGAQQVCSDQVVTERRPQSDDHQVAGTVIGAIAGGVIGNQFGRGNGRKLTTVAGAVGGGIAGKKIQEAHQDNDTVTRVVKRCRNVTPGKDSPQLYEVVYAYQGQNLHVKLDYDPGSRIALPVRGVR
ncbi:MAG: glycine zipper 2TM domain-containing protein [Proteobacteria bacterium]|nr:glycine zipper 2TM domain-containing protein [Pseudomonadota bacterium]